MWVQNKNKNVFEYGSNLIEIKLFLLYYHLYHVHLIQNRGRYLPASIGILPKSQQGNKRCSIQKVSFQNYAVGILCEDQVHWNHWQCHYEKRCGVAGETYDWDDSDQVDSELVFLGGGQGNWWEEWHYCVVFGSFGGENTAQQSSRREFVQQLELDFAV